MVTSSLRTSRHGMLAGVSGGGPPPPAKGNTTTKRRTCGPKTPPPVLQASSDSKWYSLPSAQDPYWLQVIHGPAGSSPTCLLCQTLSPVSFTCPPSSHSPLRPPPDPLVAAEAGYTWARFGRSLPRDGD